jgi:hypothetical protein
MVIHCLQRSILGVLLIPALGLCLQDYVSLRLNPLPSLTLQSAQDLNVLCQPKCYKALLLSYTFKCLLKKRSLSAHAVGL